VSPNSSDARLTLFVLATLSKAMMAFTGGMRIVNFLAAVE